MCDKKDLVTRFTKWDIVSRAKHHGVELSVADIFIDIFDMEEFAASSGWLVHRANIRIHVCNRSQEFSGVRANIKSPTEFLRYLKSRYTRQGGAIELEAWPGFGQPLQPEIVISMTGCKYSSV